MVKGACNLVSDNYRVIFHFFKSKLSIEFDIKIEI